MTRRSSRRAATWRLRLLRALVAVILAVLGAVAVGSPAAASAKPIGDCTTTSGVVLAVDFGHWGGPILRSCGSTPTTGFTLLNEGGWHTTGTGHDGPAFICRIGYDGFHGGTQYPTNKDEPCVLTPPASAYWSYWHADPGQNTWSYSQLGAMSYRPKPGSVDLWNFGGTNIAGTTGSGIPTVSPDSLRAHNSAPIGGTPGKSTPTPKHPVTTAPTRPVTDSTSTSSGAGTTTATPSSTQGLDGLTISELPPSPSPSATCTATSPSPSPSVSPSPSMSPSPSISVSPSGPGISVSPSATAPPAPSATPCIADAPIVGPRRIDHGSTTPAIIALVIVVVLGGAGVTAALRRPRREQSEQ